MTSEHGVLKKRVVDLLTKFSPLHKDDIAAALDAREVSLNCELHNLKRLGKIGKSRSTEGYWYALDTECPRSESN